MPLSYKTAKQILQDYKIPMIHQAGSHEQYSLGGVKATLPKHKELIPATAKSFLDQVASIANTSRQDLLQRYNIKL